MGIKLVQLIDELKSVAIKQDGKSGKPLPNAKRYSYWKLDDQATAMKRARTK